ncbi:MAG: NADH-quinone oxidoreductase subunit NuoE [Dehalococcoidia bacterium]|nr:NADH-quinone oxidoreductase subunit NuoE [Dehalococcoidia bacterium]
MSGDILTMEKGRDELLVALQEAQRKYGYLPEDYMAQLAESLDISLSEVYGVATFYSFLATKPQGKYVIRVCKSVPCYLKEAESMIEFMERELGIKPGETTADGRFTLQLVNCIGACDKPPAMLVNDELHGDLTPGKIKQILSSCK